MKLLSLLLCLCLTFNVFAASTVSELERQLDEYQYVMTVEWDQKDQAFQEKETKAFFQKISQSIQAGGVSKETILALAASKIKNEQALNALKLKLSLLTDVNTSAELAQVLRENSKEFYGQGASWNGDIVTPMIIVGVVALVAYVIWFGATHTCVAWEERWECNTTNSEYSSTTSCGWEDYCTQYVKD